MCFVRATLPLYYMFKIFGLSTIHIRKDEKTKKFKYVFTKNTTLEYIYCFVVLALLQIACLADILLGSLEEDETLEVSINLVNIFLFIYYYIRIKFLYLVLPLFAFQLVQLFS